jgi:hypothetical protein
MDRRMTARPCSSRSEGATNVVNSLVACTGSGRGGRAVSRAPGDRGEKRGCCLGGGGPALRCTCQAGRLQPPAALLTRRSTSCSSSGVMAAGTGLPWVARQVMTSWMVQKGQRSWRKKAGSRPSAAHRRVMSESRRGLSWAHSAVAGRWRQGVTQGSQSFSARCNSSRCCSLCRIRLVSSRRGGQRGRRTGERLLGVGHVVRQRGAGPGVCRGGIGRCCQLGCPSPGRANLLPRRASTICGLPCRAPAAQSRGPKAGTNRAGAHPRTGPPP